MSSPAHFHRSPSAARVVQGSFRAESSIARFHLQPATNLQPATPAGRSAALLPDPRSVLSASTSGRPLPDALRNGMERLFGANFADVRVHVGPQAASLGAHALTVGSNLYFAPGGYDPASPHGLRLLGHELTHVVQQRTGRVRNPFGTGVAVVRDPGLEAEAQRMAIRACRELSHPTPPQATAGVHPSSRSALQPSRSPGARMPAEAGVLQPSWLLYGGSLLVGGLLLGAGAWAVAEVEPPPVPPTDRNVYWRGIDATLWNRLTSGVPRHLYWRGGKALVDLLFTRFVRYGFRYHLMENGASGILGNSGHRRGNCKAYALAFATILNAFGIKAEARAVREEEEGRFIVRLRRFIDPGARGHLYDNDRLLQGYYMFTDHAATWVPSLGLFYDPMSTESYRSWASCLVCELDDE